MASLTAKELFKYDWRAEVFLRKYKANEKFQMTGGAKVVLKYNNAVAAAVTKRDAVALNKLKLEDTKGTMYAFGKLEKTKEDFGGGGTGSGTTKEDAQLASLQKQINEIKVKLGRASFIVRIGHKQYQVAGAETTAGTPKSDFQLTDTGGKAVVWISHKDGSTAKDFQQWGGMTEPEILSHKEVKSFIAKVQSMYPNAIPRATTVARAIHDKKLKCMSIYGVNYGKSLGEQNVTILIQGPVNLVQQGSEYVFKSNHIHTNGQDMHGTYAPTLMAMYKGDRSQFKVVGARFAITPLGGRKITEMV